MAVLVGPSRRPGGAIFAGVGRGFTPGAGGGRGAVGWNPTLPRPDRNGGGGGVTKRRVNLRRRRGTCPFLRSGGGGGEGARAALAEVGGGEVFDSEESRRFGVLTGP